MLLKRRQAANDWERDALKVKDYKIRAGREAGQFETVIPVKSSSGRGGMGILRIGVSTRRYDSMVVNAVVMGALIGALALLVGCAIFKSVGNQIENSSQLRR